MGVNLKPRVHEDLFQLTEKEGILENTTAEDDTVQLAVAPKPDAGIGEDSNQGIMKLSADGSSIHSLNEIRNHTANDGSLGDDQPRLLLADHD